MWEEFPLNAGLREVAKRAKAKRNKDILQLLTYIYQTLACQGQLMLNVFTSFIRLTHQPHYCVCCYLKQLNIQNQ